MKIKRKREPLRRKAHRIKAIKRGYYSEDTLKDKFPKPEKRNSTIINP